MSEKTLEIPSFLQNRTGFGFGFGQLRRCIYYATASTVTKILDTNHGFWSAFYAST